MFHVNSAVRTLSEYELGQRSSGGWTTTGVAGQALFTMFTKRTATTQRVPSSRALSEWQIISSVTARESLLTRAEQNVFAKRT